jgi:xanthine dehydrogenase accessory factor
MGVYDETLPEWLGSTAGVAVATLVETDGSAPLDPGATMLIDTGGRIDGSVTGGCVEAELFEEAQAVLAGGAARVLRYGISDELAGGAGLMCGGVVDIFVDDVSRGDRAPLQDVAAAVCGGEPVALVTVLDGPAAGGRLAVRDDATTGTLGLGSRFDGVVADAARGALTRGVTAVRRYGHDGAALGDDVRVFIHTFAAPPHLVIFGAIDFSAAVAAIGFELGYRVTICDARPQFAGSPRFSRHAEVVVDWPDRHLAGRNLGPRDAVLVFTHDRKFDEPALLAALETDAGYIGALGSRRTQAQRRERLTQLGVSEEQLARVSAPCGLDIGARTPAETAVSILAEIIARGACRLGAPLAGSSGSIRGRAIPTALSGEDPM